jgi:ADP-ribosylglycohydrolase
MCIGGIIGDICGSIYERKNKYLSRANFKLFPSNVHYTDDTILIIATCDAILNNREYRDVYREYYHKHSYAGFGHAFKEWAKSDTNDSYNSYGNGSAMRVSPIAWVYNTKQEIMEQAKQSAIVTHSHEEGIKGAQAIAYATFLARMGCSKKEIRSAMENEIGYDLLNIKRGFDSSCQGSVPNAIVAFLNSDSFIDTIRKAILIGGDSDTIACMAASIAQAYYGVGLSAIPQNMINKVFKRLPDDLAEILTEFTKKYIDKNFVRPSKMSKNAELYDLFRSIFKNK